MSEEGLEGSISEEELIARGYRKVGTALQKKLDLRNVPSITIEYTPIEGIEGKYKCNRIYREK